MTAAECRCTWSTYEAACPFSFHRHLAAQPQPVTASPVSEWYVPAAWDQEVAK